MLCRWTSSCPIFVWRPVTFGFSDWLIPEGPGTGAGSLPQEKLSPGASPQWPRAAPVTKGEDLHFWRHKTSHWPLETCSYFEDMEKMGCSLRNLEPPTAHIKEQILMGIQSLLPYEKILRYYLYAWNFLAVLALAGEGSIASTSSVPWVSHLTPSHVAQLYPIFLMSLLVLCQEIQSCFWNTSQSFVPCEMLLYLDICTVYLSCTPFFFLSAL